MSKVETSLMMRVGAGVGVVAVLALLSGLIEPGEAKLPDDQVVPQLGPGLAPSAGAKASLPANAGVASSAREPMAAPRPMTLSAASPVARLDNGRAQPASAARPAGRFDVSSAERLTIKFQGYAELSGEYRVNPDETISVPVLGRLSVAGMIPAELEQVLAERAGKVTGRETYVTVEVSEYRPVFVTGYVNKPGASPWKPGMTVLHAVTLLGGVYRPTSDNSGNVVIGADNEIVRIKRATTDLKRVFASMARLQAERQEKDVITTPDKLIALVGKAEADRMIEEQKTALTSRRTGVTAQLAALQRARAISEQELVGLQDQSVRLKAMLAVRRDYKTKIEGLQAKGIVRADRSMEETSKVSELEDRATTTAVGIARVQGTIASLERDTIFLKQERIASIDAELLKLDREVAQLELDIDSARNAYKKITGMPAPSTFTEQELGKTSLIEYEIVRQDGAGQTSQKVDQFAALRPGDILLVSTRQD